MRSNQIKIQEAARDLYLEEGPGGFSMRKVAGKIGITATAIYRHYADKQELLDRITDKGFSILEGYLSRAAKRGDPIEGLKAVAFALLRFSFRHPGYFELLFISQRPNIRRFPDDFARRQSKTFQVLADQVARGMEARALRDADVMATSLGLWALGHGLVCLYRSGRFGSDQKRFRRYYRRIMIQHIEGLECERSG